MPLHDSDGTDITDLLDAWHQGNEAALQELMPLVYRQLHQLAQRAMAGERRNHTLQPTALLHEAYLRLAASQPQWQDRKHFFAVMARTMRRVLVDHARRFRTEKRGGGLTIALTQEPAAPAGESVVELLALDRALTDLGNADARKARVVELRFFAGLDVRDTAELLGVSKATVVLDTQLARTWLFARMTHPPEASQPHPRGTAG